MGPHDHRARPPLRRPGRHPPPDRDRDEPHRGHGAGNLISTTDREPQTTTFTYDALNRRSQATYADGAIATFTYDAGGRLTLADDTADPHRPIALTYDTLDRLLAETTVLGTVTYRYDSAGRRTHMTVGGQAPVAYAYDAASRLTQLVQEPLAPVALQYDAAGRRTLLTLPNQVSTEYQYDPASRLTALIYRTALGLLGDLTYTYDLAGNRTSVGGTFARTLLPDPVPSATYDAANQQVGFGDKTVSFGANGNLASLTDPNGTSTFTWDARGRLVGLVAPGTGASFTYDGIGRRATKTANGAPTQYLYDGLDIVEELITGTPVLYFRTFRLDEPLVRNGSEYYLADHLGSILALTDSTGALTTHYTYDPFGRTASDGSASGNLYQYTARENDGIAGLYWYRSRFYAQPLHRSLTEDLIGLLGGINLYRYVRNSPVSFLDPLGFDVTVYYYPPSPGAIAHNSIQVNAGPIYGFYPHPDFRYWSPIKVVPGDLRRDVASPTSVVIPTTRAQEEIIQGIITDMIGRQALGGRDPYNAFGFGGNNCATFVTSVLQAAGVQVPTTRLPLFLFLKLQPTPEPGLLFVTP